LVNVFFIDEIHSALLAGSSSIIKNRSGFFIYVEMVFHCVWFTEAAQ
jgi:hypothetical protein